MKIFLFSELLGLVFIAAKLFHAVEWSWWIVALPIYWFPALFLVIFVVCAQVFGSIDLGCKIYEKIKVSGLK